MKFPFATNGALKLAADQKTKNNPAEFRLWIELDRRWGFRFQVPFGPYVADFLSERHSIIVEVDGKGHRKPRGLAHDEKRDAFARAHGFKVVRISAGFLFRSPGRAIEKIADAIGEHRARNSKTEKKRRARMMQRYLVPKPKKRKPQKKKPKEENTIPGPFASPEVVAAFRHPPKPAPTWKNPRPLPNLPKPRKPPPPSKSLKRPGGVYRAWQAPEELPALEL